MFATHIHLCLIATCLVERILSSDVNVNASAPSPSFQSPPVPPPILFNEAKIRAHRRQLVPAPPGYIAISPAIFAMPPPAEITPPPPGGIAPVVEAPPGVVLPPPPAVSLAPSQRCSDPDVEPGMCDVNSANSAKPLFGLTFRSMANNALEIGEKFSGKNSGSDKPGFKIEHGCVSCEKVPISEHFATSKKNQKEKNSSLTSFTAIFFIALLLFAKYFVSA